MISYTDSDEQWGQVNCEALNSPDMFWLRSLIVETDTDVSGSVYAISSAPAC